VATAGLPSGRSPLSEEADAAGPRFGFHRDVDAGGACLFVTSRTRDGGPGGNPIRGGGVVARGHAAVGSILRVRRRGGRRGRWRGEQHRGGQPLGVSRSYVLMVVPGCSGECACGVYAQADTFATECVSEWAYGVPSSAGALTNQASSVAGEAAGQIASPGVACAGRGTVPVRHASAPTADFADATSANDSTRDAVTRFVAGEIFRSCSRGGGVRYAVVDAAGSVRAVPRASRGHG